MKANRRWRLLTLLRRETLFAFIGGGALGMVFVLVLIEFDHFTSSEQFCTSCHSMELVAEPYRQSPHYNSASGVRASCGDCHVSEGVISATWDHFVGGKDLLKQIKGAIAGPNYDDPVVSMLHLPDAAFAARRWFIERDSATCKRCHVQQAIQGSRLDTARVHREDAQGKTCVHCHVNLVHRKVPQQKTFKREAWNRMVEEEFELPRGSAKNYF